MHLSDAAKSLLRFLVVFVAAGSAAGVAQADGGPIMPLSQVHRGMNCTGYTVIQGTTVSPFAVHILGVVAQPGAGPRVLISVSGPAVASSGIAFGFSGSPVYCKASNGTEENIGAISEGVGQYRNNVGLLTPIQQMLGEPVRPPIGAPRFSAKTTSLLGPLTVSGVSPVLMSLLQRAGKRAGRLVVAAASGSAPSLTGPPLAPGSAVGVSYSTGVIGMGAVGTVTYRKASTVYLFGHPLDEVGRRSLILQDAYVYGVIDDPDPLLGSYKLAAPTQTVGTVTSDTPNAVIGVMGQGPPTIPVGVSAHDLDTGHTIFERTNVADESGVDFPLGSSLLDLIAPFAVGQAAIDIYNGPPANESGRMCLRIVLREQDTVLHFCNRYVGTGFGFGPEVALGAMGDVGSALSLLDSVQFTTLHVKSMRASINASRGLAEASILTAHAPLRVQPGQRVTVHLGIKAYRKPQQTIAVKLRIPRDARGPLPVTITGPSGGDSLGGLLLFLGASLGGGPPGSHGPPTSLAELQTKFAHIPPYDGLSAVFGVGRGSGSRHSGSSGSSSVVVYGGKSKSSGPGKLIAMRPPKPERIYRDPKLVITGSAPLVFDVK